MSDNNPALPLVSVITPSYNQGEYLEATICSVLEQDYPAIEYLVLDGGSSDNSPDIIARYVASHPQRLVYWESQRDRGQTHAINKGLQRARGQILGWVNSDDVLLPGMVSRVVQAFAQHPEVDVVYGRLERINPSGELVPTPALPKDRLTMGPAHLIGECIVNQPGSFWRRRIMEQVGFPDESLRYSMDNEYWMRITLAGGRFLHLPEPVALFRLSPGSKTVGQTTAQAVEQIQVLEQLLARPDLPARLGLSPAQVRRQAARARAVIDLHACYGAVKLRRPGEAFRWLWRAVRSDPAALLQRRWLDLAIAGFKRRRRG